MMRIRKGYNLKIVSITISLLFLINSTLYSSPVLRKALRPPSSFQNNKARISGALNSVSDISKDTTMERLNECWEEEKETIKSKVGYFDEANMEYAVTDSDAPPYTTIGGLLFGEEYKHAIFYSNGAGFTWDKEDPRERRLTRFTLGGSEEARIGRYLYIRDMETEEFWSASAQPVTDKKFTSYECRLGFGYMKITSEYNDIVVEQLVFIPLGKGAPEVQAVRIKNVSGRPRKLMLFSYREFPSGTPEQEMKDPQNFKYVNWTEVDGEDSRIIECKTFSRRNISDEPEKNKPIIFFAANKKAEDVQTSLEDFLGARGSLENPLWIRKLDIQGKLSSSGGTGIASQKFEIELEANQEYGIDFILSTADNEEDCRKVTEKWLDGQGSTHIVKEFERLRNYGKKKIERFHCQIPDKATELMANIFGPIQVYANWLFSRSVGSRASGLSRGLGTRDSWQDILGYVYMMPVETRKRIIRLMKATHLTNGASLHSFDPRTRKPMEGEGFGDDHLWAIMAIDAYIRETGDFGIMAEKVSYADEPQEEDTIYNHLIKSLKFSYKNLGPHGIPLLLRADWNDANQRLYKEWYSKGYNEKNFEDKLKKSKAESVMVGCMLVRAAKDMKEITVALDENIEIDVQDRGKIIGYLKKIINEISNNINEHAWSEKGNYYAAGTDDNSDFYGIPTDKEGQIYLIPQVWAVISGVAQDKNRDRICMKATMKRLLRKRGLFLLDPVHDKTAPPLGNIDFYLPYFKENGLFLHAAAMAFHALLIADMGDEAYEAFQANLPPLVSKEDPWNFRTAPFSWPQVINGKDGEFGAGGDWLTGTAAWYVAGLHQRMLGIVPEYGGLRIEPCIPKDWDEFTIKRKFRGVTYNIKVKNPEHVSKGIKSITVNEQVIKGSFIPLNTRCRKYQVEVTMGN